MTQSETFTQALITSVAVQAGRIERLGGASYAAARHVAMEQFLYLLAATGSSAPGWVRTFDELLQREFLDVAAPSDV